MAYAGILSLVGYALALRVLTRRDPGILIYFSVCSLIALLYVAALAGILHAAAHVLYLGGFVAGVAGMGIHVRRKGFRELGAWLATPAVIVFVVLSGFASLKLRDATFLAWDEFSHWGRLTKELSLLNRLPASQDKTSVFFPHYPPGSNLFHYFFTGNTGFSEGTTRAAAFVLLLAPLMVLITGSAWRMAHRGILKVLLALGLAALFRGNLTSPCVDMLLAANFGVLLLLCAREYPTSRNVWLLGPALLVLPLIKHIGMYLALVVLMAAALSWVVGFRRRQDAEQMQGAKRSPWRRLGPVLVWALVISAPLLATESWHRHCRNIGIDPTRLMERASVGGIRLAFSPNATEKDKTVRANFRSAFLDQSLNEIFLPPSVQVWLDRIGCTWLISPQNEVFVPESVYEWLDRIRCTWLISLLTRSARTWLIAGVVLSAIATLLARGPARWRLLVVASVTWTGFGAYSFMLLVGYLLLFIPIEAVKVASFARYVNIYMYAAVLFAVMTLFDQLEARAATAGRKWGVAVSTVLVAVAAVTTVLVWESPAVWCREVGWPLYPSVVRAKLRPKMEYVRACVPLDKTIYQIAQNTTGALFCIVSYELCPRRTQPYPFSLGKPYSAGDVWTADIIPEQWAKHLNENSLDYVLIVRADDRFWRDYGYLFSTDRKEDDFLFAVRTTGRTSVELVPVRRETASANGDMSGRTRQ